MNVASSKRGSQTARRRRNRRAFASCAFATYPLSMPTGLVDGLAPKDSASAPRADSPQDFGGIPRSTLCGAEASIRLGCAKSAEARSLGRPRAYPSCDAIKRGEHHGSTLVQILRSLLRLGVDCLARTQARPSLRPKSAATTRSGGFLRPLHPGAHIERYRQPEKDGVPDQADDKGLGVWWARHHVFEYHRDLHRDHH